MRIDFDFTDLETFLAVLETGSFHQAADQLGLSQSSVTRRIRKLEVALDAELFKRTTRDVKPTLAAKRLKLRAETILSETRETARAMRDESAFYAHQRARSIAVATMPTLIAGTLTRALKHLEREQSHLRIRILDLSANEVAEAVATGEADVGFCSVPAFDPATKFERLFDDPIVIALPPDHPLTHHERLRWSDLNETDLILPNRGTGNRMLIDDALARAGLPLVWKIEVGRTASALDCVRAGLGVAAVPQSAALAVHNSLVSIRSVSAPDVARPVGLLTRIGSQENNVVRQFIDALRLSINKG